MIVTSLWRFRELGKLDELQKRILELECEVNDKQYEINKLKSECEKIHNQLTETEKAAHVRISELECKIAEYEKEKDNSKTCTSDVAPSREWLEDRHQSDCIEINRLNVTIEVLADKYSRLRQQIGL